MGCPREVTEVAWGPSVSLLVALSLQTIHTLVADTALPAQPGQRGRSRAWTLAPKPEKSLCVFP